MSLNLHRLTPQHIQQIMELDRRTYPAAFTISAEEYYYYLAWGEIKGTNHSVGVFDQDKLVGYVVMMLHPSLVHSGEEIAFVLSLAVDRKYRRTAIEPLLAWLLREALICGHSIEGRMRERTSYGMILRNWRLIRRYGFRVTQLVASDPMNDERMFLIRFDHIFMRDPLVWNAYQTLVHAERARRMLQALPRRALRKVCRRMPETAVSPLLRRLTYLNQPDVPGQPESAAQH